MLAAAGNAKSTVRVGCQTRSYGEPPRTLAGLLPLIADMTGASYQGFETNYVFLIRLSMRRLPDLKLKSASP